MVGIEAHPRSLRERKKALTRDTIVAVAERLFEARGFDSVTVAEIADAANISVKTLFVYFRSKEELAFADTTLRDALLAALRDRAAGETHADAIGRALGVALREEGAGVGLERYHRGFGESAALVSGLLRLWADYEERFTAFLAAEAGGAATPAMRLYAMQLVAIVRSLVAPELRAAVAGRGDDEARAVVERWLAVAVRRVGSYRGDR